MMTAEPVDPQPLSEAEARQAQRHLAAMSLAVEHIAMTVDPDDLESLWAAYFTNQRSLGEVLPRAREGGGAIG